MKPLQQLIPVILVLGLWACSSPPKKTVSATDGASVTDTASTDTAVTSGAGSSQISASALDASLDGDLNKLDDAQDVFLAYIIYFEYDQSAVPKDYEASLQGHAEKLLQNPNLHIRLEGHADERGTREYNTALAERRGNAVARFLKLLRVPQNRIEVVSYGEERPVNEGHSEIYWSENRRVEIKYVEQ